MGNKIWVSGLTILLAFPVLFPTMSAAEFAGALLAVVGAVLILMDK